MGMLPGSCGEYVSVKAPRGAHGQGGDGEPRVGKPWKISEAKRAQPVQKKAGPGRGEYALSIIMRPRGAAQQRVRYRTEREVAAGGQANNEGRVKRATRRRQFKLGCISSALGRTIPKRPPARDRGP